MDSRSAGVLIVVLGLGVIVVGALVYSGALGWFGRLPGDIRFERGSTRVFFPLTSMIVVSILLSLALSIVRRLL